MAKKKPITERENLLMVLNHQKGLWVPGRDAQSGIGLWDPIEKGGISGGLDGFGVNWVDMIPEPGRFLLKYFTQRKKLVTNTDVDKKDWAKKAE